MDTVLAVLVSVPALQSALDRLCQWECADGTTMGVICSQCHVPAMKKLRKCLQVAGHAGIIPVKGGRP